MSLSTPTTMSLSTLAALSHTTPTTTSITTYPESPTGTAWYHTTSIITIVQQFPPGGLGTTTMYMTVEWNRRGEETATATAIAEASVIRVPETRVIRVSVSGEEGGGNVETATPTGTLRQRKSSHLPRLLHEQVDDNEEEEDRTAILGTHTGTPSLASLATKHTPTPSTLSTTTTTTTTTQKPTYPQIGSLPSAADIPASWRESFDTAARRAHILALGTVAAVFVAGVLGVLVCACWACLCGERVWERAEEVEEGGWSWF